jgi:hypothetical protein
MDIVVDKVFDIGITSEKPQKLVDNPFEKYFFGSEEGKSFCEIKTHLIAKN